MKKFKKIMAVLVAAMMIISSFTLTAFAANTDFKVIISNALKGETYSAFKIFDAPQASTLTTTNVYVEVPLESITEDANRGITYYYLDGTTYKVIDDRATFAATNTNHAFEASSKPVSYTISTSNPWYSLVKDYADDTDNGLILTSTVGDINTKLVTIEEGTFNAADFAQYLKDAYDATGGSTGKIAADSKTYDGTSGTTDANGITTGALTLNVGTLDTDDGKNVHRGPGYYFVNTTSGALCALDTTTTTATVKEKNTIPTLDKKVWHSTAGTDATPEWTTAEESQIGDKSYFLLTVTDGFGTDKDIVVNDKLSTGLTYDADTVAVYRKVNDVERDATKLDTYYEITTKTPTLTEDTALVPAHTYYTLVTKAGNWSVATSGLNDIKDRNGDSFAANLQVTLDKSYVKNSLDQGDQIVIWYSATMNKNALIYSDANTNDAFLAYASQKSVTVSVNVYTYDVHLVKYDNEDKKMLANAQFQLYRADDPFSAGAVSGTPVKFSQSTTTYTVDPNGTVDTLTTSKDTYLTIQGLDADTYYLVETAAPDGYNALTAPVKVVVSQNASAGNANVVVTVGKLATGGLTATYAAGDAVSGTGDATIGTNTWTSGGVAIGNTPGKELPSTGGMGTTVLYIVGGMLVILAGAYLFFSRKKTA